MGTRVAPTYANLFTGKLEKEMLQNCPQHLKQLIHTWKRFIDDILIIWTGTEDDFLEFFNYLNSYHPTIKFDPAQHNSEENSCEFLDLKIFIKDGKIQTDLFRKQTAKPTALLPSSAHPGHVTSNIIYSMAFRLLRICSDEEYFEDRLSELKSEFLLPRNYHSKVIDSQFSRVRNLPGGNYIERRANALKKKEIVNNDDKKTRVIAPIDFNPRLPKLNEVFNKHFKAMLFKKPELKTTFEAPPMAALRQPPNLRKIICRSTLPTIKRSDRYTRNSHKSAPGWRKCGKGSTTCCPYALPPTNQVTGLVTGYNHKITDAVDCLTENCVYYWRCKKSNCKAFPKCEYVGLTRRAFKTRIGEHKQNVRSRNLDTPSGFHFNQPGHDLSHFAGLVLEKVKSSDPFVLRAREFYIFRNLIATETDSTKNLNGCGTTLANLV
jgi:hypothetical protein